MNSKEEKKKSESESITFRIPSKLLNELRRESEKKQVSLNTLSNQIFTDYMVWHTYAKQTGLFYVPKPLISRTVNELTEEQLSSIAKEAVKDKLKARGEDQISSIRNVRTPIYQSVSLLDRKSVV